MTRVQVLKRSFLFFVWLKLERAGTYEGTFEKTSKRERGH